MHPICCSTAAKVPTYHNGACDSLFLAGAYSDQKAKHTATPRATLTQFTRFSGSASEQAPHTLASVKLCAIAPHHLLALANRFGCFKRIFDFVAHGGRACQVSANHLCALCDTLTITCHRVIAPMVALARGLGAACRVSVARLRPAESDVRGRPSTRSKTFGAVRQVRGGAEAGFWVVCWVARGSARQLAAAGSFSNLGWPKDAARGLLANLQFSRSCVHAIG